MSDESPQGSPFARPGFVVAAVGIGVILVVGGVIAGRVLTGGDDEAAPQSAPTDVTGTAAAPVVEEVDGPDGSDSVCGLRGVEESGSLSMPPEAEWAYQGTTAYPTSTEFGPGAAFDDGIRYCFQRSPEGALFAAANAAVQAGEVATMEEFITYFLADGPNREQVLALGGLGGDTSGQGSAEGQSDGYRQRIAGFRVLSYTGDEATVDVGIESSVDGQPVSLSMVYALVWQNGDWHLSVEEPRFMIDGAVVPDLAGYVMWGP